MSENVPTFGRENLASEGEKTEWDRLEQWHKQLTESELVWEPGDSPTLPPVPDGAYPPDAVDLPEST